MDPAGYLTRNGLLFWQLFFALKLIASLAVTGIVYYETSTAFFWRLSFIVLSIAVFLFVRFRLPKVKARRNVLIQVLILDFLVSAAYGYVFIGGQVPNQLLVGITALAILMFPKSFRSIIVTCVALLAVYLTIMIAIDWYVFEQLDEVSYFMTCSFIVFAGIVCLLLYFYQRARQDALHLYAQLRESHERLQEYALQAEEWGAARERVTIARELHDSVGHKLTGLIVQMQAARKLSRVDSERSGRIYSECEELLRASLQEIRLAVRTIRDEPVQSTFLPESLDKLSEEFTRYAEVETRFYLKGDPVPLPGELQLTAYRITQESLTNAKKHGRANKASIQLAYDAGGLSIVISNDGLLPGELKPGFGLLNMQERVKEWHGEVSFGKEGDRTFSVRASLPYPAAGMEGERQ
ncbi:sensor histidine kinase [Paenibacillus terrigena]|uniref:sensor histidine kinase n=1 Tax=Paenibacillus terrigena TaxID=369333 RepID=UPI0028D0A49C|nr:sensor histidine kinase [Paenibacillus terrigena]